MTRLTQQYLHKLMKEDPNHYYGTPKLNSTLYLHYKGIKKIENLEMFPDLKVLYLEGNGLSHIENIEMLTSLSILYLHENCIGEIENISKLTKLNTLNLSQNQIKTIQNLQNIPIENLNLSLNKIGEKGVSDYEHLKKLSTVSSLDISQNKIEDLEILDILANMENLKILYLHGNPVCKNINNYRKKIIYLLKKLTFLDDRPITEEERIYATVIQIMKAFFNGGREAEKAARLAQKDKVIEQQMVQVQKTNEMLARQREQGINQLPQNYYRRHREESERSDVSLFMQTRQDTTPNNESETSGDFVNTGQILDELD